MCFEGAKQEMTSPMPGWLQGSGQQYGGQLSAGLGQGATQMPADMYNQYQQAYQVPGLMDFGGAPGAWGTAEQAFTGLAQGQQIPTPQAWLTGQKFATDVLGQGGMPTTYDPWYKQMQGVVGEQVGKAGKDIAEQFGLAGLRQSTGLGQQLGELAGQAQGQLGAQYAGLEVGAQEAARQRQIQAGQQLYGYGAGEAGLGQFQQQMQLGAGQGLTGLGYQQSQLPIQQALAAQGISGQQQQQNIQAFAPQFQEFMRNAAENNPWIQQLMGAFQSVPQNVPQLYQPSGFSQFGNMASMPLAMGLSGGICGKGGG